METGDGLGEAGWWTQIVALCRGTLRDGLESLLTEDESAPRTGTSPSAPTFRADEGEGEWACMELFSVTPEGRLVVH